MYLLWGHVDTSFPLQGIVGPDWPCMLVTYTLIIGGGLIVCAYVIRNTVLGDIGVIVELSLALTTSLTFTCAACSEPGILFSEIYDNVGSIEMEEGEGGKTKNRCIHCDVVRPPGVSHCYDCGVCVHDLDHHCPWTGKCIGKKNLKWFYVFLSCLLGLISFSVLGLVMWTVSPVEN